MDALLAPSLAQRRLHPERKLSRLYAGEDRASFYSGLVPPEALTCGAEVVLDSAALLRPKKHYCTLAYPNLGLKALTDLLDIVPETYTRRHGSKRPLPARSIVLVVRGGALAKNV